MKVASNKPLLCFFLLLGLTFTLLAGCGENDFRNFPFGELEDVEEEPLLIGQVPSRSIIEIIEDRRLFMDSLGEHLDRDVQYRFAPSYEEIVRRLEEGRYDLAVLGPLSYVEAAEKTDYLPLAKPVRYGEPHYKALIITHRESGIESADQIEGGSIGFVDPDSASGFLFPRAHLVMNYGFDPAVAPTIPNYLGGHDAVVRAVLNREVAAGAVYDDARREVVDPDEADELLPVLTKTDPIPAEPFVISKQLTEDEALYQKIKDYFFNLHETDREALTSLGGDIDKYVPAEDSDYDGVREVSRTLEEINGSD